MKFSVCLDAVYKDRPLDDALREIKETGIGAVEFWDWRNKDIALLETTLRALNMSVAAFCTTCFDLTADEAHGRYLQGLQSSIAVARRLGCGRLITQVGQALHGVSREQQHQNIVMGLKRCVPALEAADMELVFEPLNATDHPGYYLTHAQEALHIAREVGSPHVKILFDVYHQQITQGNLINNLRELLGQTGHIHCAGNPGRGELDCGEIRYEGVFEVLEDHGYAGYVGLEYFPRHSPRESLARLAAQYAGTAGL